jgi:thiol-disulfide isomerase/thioredoxin
MRKNILFLVLALLCLDFSSQGQSKIPDYLPLKIGDQLPESFWQLEHLIYNSGKTTRQKLSAYKGKLIILDFWATWCTACLKSFPKMAQLEKQFDEKLVAIKVTYQSLEIVSEFDRGPTGMSLKENVGSELSSVVQDKAFTALFPHKLIPHLVYIGTDGRVIGFSDSQELNAELIQAMLTGDNSNIPNKQDYETHLPLFLARAYDKIVSYSVLYKGHISGLTTGNYFRRKGGAVYGKAMTNYPLLNLYSLAAGEVYPWLNSKRIISEASNLDVLTAYNRDSSNPNTRPNLYTVDICLPPAKTNLLYRKMLDLLNESSDFNGMVQRRKVKCLVLVKKGRRVPEELNSKGGELALHFFADGKPGVLSNVSMSDFVVTLNNLEQITPLIIDETGIEQKVDLRLAPFSSLESLNNDLSQYGLQIKEAERPLDVFVIQDDKPTN